VSKP
jgi:hypothetical protein